MSRRGEPAGPRSAPRLRTTTGSVAVEPRPSETIADILEDRWNELGFHRQASDPGTPFAEQSRWEPTESIAGSGMHGDYPELQDDITLIRLLKAFPGLIEELIDACTVVHDTGRRRMAGHWALAFFGWVDSGNVPLRKWHNKTSAAFWRECGFSRVPLYDRVTERFNELEEFSDAFDETLGRIVRHARTHHPGIAKVVFVDGTMVESVSRAVPAFEDAYGVWRRKTYGIARMSTTQLNNLRHAIGGLPTDQAHARSFKAGKGVSRPSNVALRSSADASSTRARERRCTASTRTPACASTSETARRRPAGSAPTATPRPTRSPGTPSRSTTFRPTRTSYTSSRRRSRRRDG